MRRPATRKRHHRISSGALWCVSLQKTSHQNQDRELFDRFRHKSKCLDRCGIHPLHIIENDQDRGRLAGELDRIRELKGEASGLKARTSQISILALSNGLCGYKFAAERRASFPRKIAQNPRPGPGQPSTSPGFNEPVSDLKPAADRLFTNGTQQGRLSDSRQALQDHQPSHAVFGIRQELFEKMKFSIAAKRRNPPSPDPSSRFSYVLKIRHRRV